MSGDIVDTMMKNTGWKMPWWIPVLFVFVLVVLFAPTNKEVWLHEAAETGNIKAAQKWISKGANVDVRYKGMTPLLRSVSAGGDYQMVKFLISKGANVNAQGDNGYTPLDWAVDNGDRTIANLLRKHGGI